MSNRLCLTDFHNALLDEAFTQEQIDFITKEVLKGFPVSITTFIAWTLISAISSFLDLIEEVVGQQ